VSNYVSQHIELSPTTHQTLPWLAWLIMQHGTICPELRRRWSLPRSRLANLCAPLAPPPAVLGVRIEAKATRAA
jgi:hypothetical protein